MNKLQVFQNTSFGEVRVIGHDGEPWFVAKDVCDCLELGRQQDSTRYLDEDEKRECLVNTPSGDQLMVMVSEPGLYSLILRSRKPEAKKFKRWVTHDVIPTIRKTGSYGVKDIFGKPKDDFLDAFKFAKTIGITEKYAASYANNAIKRMHNVDLLGIMGIPEYDFESVSDARKAYRVICGKIIQNSRYFTEDTPDRWGWKRGDGTFLVFPSRVRILCEEVGIDKKAFINWCLEERKIPRNDRKDGTHIFRIGIEVKRLIQLAIDTE